MKAMVLYVLFVVLGGVLSYFVGRFIEFEFGSVASLIVFLTMFFANFVVSWILVIVCIDGNLTNAQGSSEQRELEKNYRATQQNPSGGGGGQNRK